MMVGGICYGWQARAIDPVDDKDRMRNNTGYGRGTLLMFADRLSSARYAVIGEGPVDAIKFDRVGGNVASMGKVVTARQLQEILKFPIEALYLALDDDAADEMTELAKQVEIPVYRLLVPQTCIDRCRISGKKPDFGECTFEECEQAFNNPIKVDLFYLMLHLKEWK
ncbi:MAG: hypothetical protein ACREGB_04705 [Candidatus Saccharimonadales bacterium]